MLVWYACECIIWNNVMILTNNLTSGTAWICWLLCRLVGMRWWWGQASCKRWGFHLLNMVIGRTWMFSRCENDWSHTEVNPNMVSAAILTQCSVWYVTRSVFLIISWCSGWSFFIFVYMGLLANSAFCHVILFKSILSDLNLFTNLSGAFRSATSASDGDTRNVNQVDCVQWTLVHMGDELKKMSVLTK